LPDKAALTNSNIEESTTVSSTSFHIRPVTFVCKQVIASQRQLEAKFNQAKDTSDQWYRRAQLALEKGDDGLAREALSRRKGYDVSQSG